MNKPEIRLATNNDIPSLCEMAKNFISESKWGFSYSDVIAISQFFKYINTDGSEIMLAIFDNEIAAAAIVAAIPDLTMEKQGFIHKFFCLPKYRKTLAPIILANKCCEWFDENDCLVSYTTSTSGISDEAICAYNKLMAKCGYAESGPTLFRNLIHG